MAFEGFSADAFAFYKRPEADNSRRSGMRTRPSISGTLRQAGLSIGSDQLQTRPRGVAADHPRLELLGHRSLTAGRDWPAGLLHNLQALNLGAAKRGYSYAGK